MPSSIIGVAFDSRDIVPLNIPMSGSTSVRTTLSGTVSVVEETSIMIVSSKLLFIFRSVSNRVINASDGAE